MEKEKKPNSRIIGGGWRPTQEQELLLQASLFQGTEAIAAWQEWKVRVNVDHLDQGSRRLLPLLYKNLDLLGIKDPLLATFKGVYRFTWMKNKLLLQSLSTLLRAFHDAGIKTLLLKGVALILLYYKDRGLRLMADGDILVHFDQVLLAIDCLKRLGFTPNFFSPTSKNIKFRHAHGFRDLHNQEIDLHWHVLSESCQVTADDDFWREAMKLEFEGIKTYTLNPTDQLLHVCIHGARWNPVPPIRWIADAMMILNTESSHIDWQRLVTQAKKHQLALPLKTTLGYLQKTFHTPIPSEYLQSLQSVPSSKIERIIYRMDLQPTTPLKIILFHWFRYSKISKKTLSPYKFLGFMRYLQYSWHRNHLWQIPFYAMKKTISWYKNK